MVEVSGIILYARFLMFLSVINRETKMTQKKEMVNSHPVVEMYAKEHLNGDMDRREFMSRATALGVTAAGKKTFQVRCAKQKYRR